MSGSSPLEVIPFHKVKVMRLGSSQEDEDYLDEKAVNQLGKKSSAAQKAYNN